MKSLSIVIIGYNTAECLKKLLLSIQEVVLPHDIAVELIYVDDCSSDNSLNLFDSFETGLTKNLIVFLKTRAGFMQLTKVFRWLLQIGFYFFRAM